MRKFLLASMLLLGTLSAVEAQVLIDKNVQMNGAAAADRRVTGLANASTVTPNSTDATNIATIQSNYLSYNLAAGTVDAATLDLTPNPAQYWEGMLVTFRASGANTGAMTLNIDGLGARNVISASGTALRANDVRAGQMVLVTYSAAANAFYMLSPKGNDAWYTNGNVGTTFGTNFIGTTDAQGLDIRTNNTERIRVNADGTVVINENGLDIGGASAYALRTESIGNDHGIRADSFTGYAGIFFADGAATFGIYAKNFNTGGTGLIAAGNNVGATYLTAGSGGSFSGGNSGVYGRSNGDNSNGVIGYSSLAGTSATIFADGSGGSFSCDQRSSAGVYGYVANPSNTTDEYGVYGACASIADDWAVYGAGDVGTTSAFVTVSDFRYKSNIRAINGISSLDRLDKLQAVIYSLKKEVDPEQGTQIGFIAQEVKKVFPELVKETGEGFLGVNYSGFVPVLTEAIKEQQIQLDAVKGQNGNCVTNAEGLAVITLPSEYTSMYTNFRYQLTVVGTFAQAIVGTEITGNTFTVKTDKPNVKVSWFVTGDLDASKMRTAPKDLNNPETFGISAEEMMKTIPNISDRNKTITSSQVEELKK